jgi:hypothetical protein
MARIVIDEGTATRIFFNGKGVEVSEFFVGKDNERRQKKFTAWFTEPVTFNVGATGKWSGLLSVKLEKWVNQDGSPKLDFNGKPGESIVISLNGAKFTEANVTPPPLPNARPEVPASWGTPVAISILDDNPF